MIEMLKLVLPIHCRMINILLETNIIPITYLCIIQFAIQIARQVSASALG